VCGASSHSHVLRGFCPYFFCRQMMAYANIIVYSYQVCVCMCMCVYVCVCVRWGVRHTWTEREYVCNLTICTSVTVSLRGVSFLLTAPVPSPSQYLLNPKIYDIISSKFSSSSIVVFDEAHNIGETGVRVVCSPVSMCTFGSFVSLNDHMTRIVDNVCIEGLSVKMGKETLDGARKVCVCVSQYL